MMMISTLALWIWLLWPCWWCLQRKCLYWWELLQWSRKGKSWAITIDWWTDKVGFDTRNKNGHDYAFHNQGGTLGCRFVPPLCATPRTAMSSPSYVSTMSSGSSLSSSSATSLSSWFLDYHHHHHHHHLYHHNFLIIIIIIIIIIICNTCILSGSQYSSVVMASEQVNHDNDTYHDNGDNMIMESKMMMMMTIVMMTMSRWTNPKFRSRATRVTMIRAGQETALRKVSKVVHHHHHHHHDLANEDYHGGGKITMCNLHDWFSITRKSAQNSWKCIHKTLQGLQNCPTGKERL